jgi:hypothetical protein
MRDGITIARELPVLSEGNAATALAPVITQDYLTYTQATTNPSTCTGPQRPSAILRRT